ncbi:MAG: D-cysteine desulfhydrase [Flavobacteriaceae bacterium]|nr:D-cysteine desulfhydrase [Flavobacteriaceae bacterium]
MLKSKVDLGFFPTPFHKLDRLSERYEGYEIYIKRDDQTGLASGGNKTRKLEYLLFEAIVKGSDTIITSGAQQSNHCRQTAAACAQLGLECHLLLGGNEPKEYEGNLLLSKLLGAKIHFSGEQRKGEGENQLKAELEKKGKRCYVVPYGGSNLTGALGFVNAAKELKKQLIELNLQIDYLFFASSSGGMQAGLTLGNDLYELNSKLIPIRIDKEDFRGKALEHQVLSIVHEGYDQLKIDKKLSISSVALDHSYDSQGYGVVSDNELMAIDTLAKEEGILLDPVYTARAFYGMLDYLGKEKIPQGSKVLFWHTGGFPAIFSKLGKSS